MFTVFKITGRHSLSIKLSLSDSVTTPAISAVHATTTPYGARSDKKGSGLATRDYTDTVTIKPRSIGLTRDVMEEV